MIELVAIVQTSLAIMCSKQVSFAYQRRDKLMIDIVRVWSLDVQVVGREEYNVGQSAIKKRISK